MTDTSQIAAVDPAQAGSTDSHRGALSALRLPQLQAIAAELGISGTARMRKSDLLEAISSRHSGSAAGSGSVKTASTRAPRRAAAPAGPPTAAERPADVDPATAPGAPTAASAPPASTAPTASTAPAASAAPRTQSEPPAVEATPVTGAASDPVAAPQEGANAPASDAPRAGESAGREGDGFARRPRRSRDNHRDSQSRADRDGQTRADRDGQTRPDRDGQTRPDRDSPRVNGRASHAAPSLQSTQPAQTPAEDDEDDVDGRGRRRRGRFRDRKRRPGTTGTRTEVGGAMVDDSELTDDDVLIPVAGILDVLDSYAFLRTRGYLPGPDDVYVSLGQVKRYGLRKGDAVVGAIRQPREVESQQAQRAKFNALVRIDSVNGRTSDEARNRPEFGKLTPLYPQERLRLETDAGQLSTRIIDLVAPIGKGQRGLIVSPPKAGKTLVLQSIANAISENNPECHLMVVLVDERPEEVTDMQRTIKGEVIASTFDRPAEDHTTVAELAIERAKRLVELGHDVVVLLDSITRLGRAYNLAAPASGRILSGGVDSSALHPPKRFFGAARNVENGGSLTIMATGLVETGSKMDEVFFEEFKGTSNMELRLSRSLADKRIFPAVDVNASGTRREEILMSKEELNVVWKLRRVMGALEPQQAIELLLDRVKGTKSNAEFLMQVQKTTPVPE